MMHTQMKKQKIACNSIISQHPNTFPNRFVSTHIDPARLLIDSKPDRYFYYGNSVFNGILFTIISYITLDDLLPILLLFLCNTSLSYQITIFSIFVVPRSFMVVFNLYGNQDHIDDTIISVVFHTCQGLEMINHAITGYASFLSCRALRKELIKTLRIIYEKLKLKKTMSELST
ncbi:hypothetical protein I4U23_018288 [Adineta vaga]|nr:hypothetical protein I4U23_018288 [Adineta vaga]